MTRITVEGLKKRYGATRALDWVSFAVEEEDFFTLVGPSGCGKTTLLRTLAGFEAPTSGEIRFDDASMASVPPEDRGVGVVFQNYALFGHMSVAENVGYGLRFADPPGGVGKSERVAELLDLVDLAGMGERSPTELSGGQQQRVALARALAPAPRVLLLDEPMSALDAGLRERLRVELASIQSELGVTTVYVTHDQEEALAVSDRVAVMSEGRIEQIGTPREIYGSPATRFVAEFVGDNNVFEGRVVEVESGSGDETEGTGEEQESGDPGSKSTESRGQNGTRPTDGRTIVTIEVGEARFRARTAAEHAEAGERVLLCVRPEDLRVETGTKEEGTNRFRARVGSSEFLGEATRVHLDWEEQSILLRTTASATPEGTIELGFDPADAHVLEG
ncbi:ABC transporter ATP-binding protein [Halobacteriales archaeon QS_3_64_16]|nr:MAG: ABC transporter ATP-binding protein [Halobacteriales archaeon QS_3_64_16]